MTKKVCCSVFQCDAVYCSLLRECLAYQRDSVLQYVAVYCNVSQCNVECCSVLQCVAMRCSVLQWCVAV